MQIMQFKRTTCSQNFVKRVRKFLTEYFDEVGATKYRSTRLS